MTRPTWDEYFLEVMKSVSLRATCDRGRNGTVVVKDKRILSTGYVGAPSGLDHCDDVGHLLRTVKTENGGESIHCLRTTHAEQNALAQAARFGISIEGATMYTKMVPCRSCAMMIINAGVKRVVCEKDYHAGADTKEMFNQVGIELVVLGEVEKYDKQ